MRALALVAAFSLAAAVPAAAQQTAAPTSPATSAVAADSATTAELVALFRGEFEAFRRHDPALAAPSFAEEARFYGAALAGRSRAEILAEIARTPASFALAEMRVEDARAFRSGELAVLVCIASIRTPPARAGGLPDASRVRVTRVHERRGGRWVLLSHQATQVEETAP